MNPDKYIRAAYITGLESVTGLDVWHKKVPKNVTPTPSMYIILGTQTKNETPKAKGQVSDITAFRRTEWMCTIVVDINRVMPQGYSNASAVDDVEEQVIDWVRTQLNIPQFYVKETEITNITSLDIDDSETSIDRKVITITHWLNER